MVCLQDILVILYHVLHTTKLQLPRNADGVIDTKCSSGRDRDINFLRNAELVFRVYHSKAGKFANHLGQYLHFGEIITRRKLTRAYYLLDAANTEVVAVVVLFIPYIMGPKRNAYLAVWRYAEGNPGVRRD